MNKDTTTIKSTSLGPEQTGLLVAHFGANVEIEDVNGKRYPCNLRQNLGDLVVGDQVIYQLDKNKTGIVVGLHPRKTILAKPNERGKLRPIAANVDQIIVVIAAKPKTPREVLDSYLVAAHALHVNVAILYNKSDLLSDDSGILDTYKAAGYETFTSSTVSSHGLNDLKTHLTGRASVFVGQSGVGKSSLISALIPKSKVAVGSLTEKGFGAHTTTTARLYHLPGQGQLIDSPGIREFGLWHMEHKDIADGFIEFAKYKSQCKFRNCLHCNEPHCAVKQAAERGDISKERLQSYYRVINLCATQSQNRDR